MKTHTNPGRVGSPKQPAKLRPGASHVCWAPSRMRRKLCYSHKVDLSLQLRSSACQLSGCRAWLLFLRRLRQFLPLTVRSCRCGRLFDCFDHYWSAFPVRGCWVVVGFHWRAWQHESAEKQAEWSERMSSFAMPCSTTWTNGDSKSSLMVCPCSGARNSPLMPLSCGRVAKPRCATENGASFVRACTRKERRYPELATAEGRARLVVLGRKSF